jgi:hypothetical protein
VPKKPESFVPRLVLAEEFLRVVRTGPESMVIEERLVDALGNASWITKIPLDMWSVHPVGGLITRDLYRIFSAIEEAR